MEKVQKFTASTEIILETRFPRKDGLFPVKLRVTFIRKQKYYILRYKIKNTTTPITEYQQYWIDRLDKGISVTKVEFSKIRQKNVREPYKTMAIYLNELEQIAREVSSSILVFNFSEFEKTYFDKPLDDQDLFQHLSTVASQLRKEGRISTAIAYECTLASLKKFTKTPTMAYEAITVETLNKYEKWMLKKGNQLTTVGIYLRNVRAVYRKALKNGLIRTGIYPFGEGNYQIPGGRNIKKALTHEDVGKIAKYSTIDGSPEQRYRDYWLFSYLCNGINVKDMACFKYGNIEGEIIKLTRAKTQREKRQNPRPITIVITALINSIIDRWGNKPAKPDTYIFPILTNKMNPEQEYAAIQQATHQINKYIDRIAKSLKINQNVTSYTARHSYATVLKRSGASIEFISESLGHSNLITTENYLADFEIEEKRKWAEKAGDF